MSTETVYFDYKKSSFEVTVSFDYGEGDDYFGSSDYYEWEKIDKMVLDGVEMINAKNNFAEWFNDNDYNNGFWEALENKIREDARKAQFEDPN